MSNTESTPTTAGDLAAIVERAMRANAGANVMDTFDILASWLAAHDAELTERVRAEQVETDAQIADDMNDHWVADTIREAGKQ